MATDRSDASLTRVGPRTHNPMGTPPIPDFPTHERSSSPTGHSSSPGMRNLIMAFSDRATTWSTSVPLARSYHLSSTSVSRRCHISSAVMSSNRRAVTLSPGWTTVVRAARATLSLSHVITIVLVSSPWPQQHMPCPPRPCPPNRPRSMRFAAPCPRRGLSADRSSGRLR